MRKTLVFWIIIYAMANLCLNGFADTVTLKSGEKLEGKITSESATGLTMDVRISAGITEPRTISKTDVAKVETVQPDDLAWPTIKTLKLGINSMPLSAYESAIRALKSFINEFPKSSRIAEAQKILAEFEEEKRRVDAGEAKLEGAWISKEEAERERYQIRSNIAFSYMKEQSTRSDSIGALNTFDVIELQFAGSRIYPDAVELAVRILNPLKLEVARRQSNLLIDVAEREKGMALASVLKRAELQAIYDREQAQADAAMVAADRNGIKWPPLMIKSEKNLAYIAAKIPDDLVRLGALDLASMRQSLLETDVARGLLLKKEFDAADAKLTSANRLWPANELTMRLQADLGIARIALPTESVPVVEPVAAPMVVQEESPGGRSRFMTLIVVVLGLVSAMALLYLMLKGRQNKGAE